MGVITMLLLIMTHSSTFTLGEERANVRRFPTPRWVQICNSSQKWYHNKTSALSSYLRDNLDVLYL